MLFTSLCYNFHYSLNFGVLSVDWNTFFYSKLISYIWLCYQSYVFDGSKFEYLSHCDFIFVSVFLYRNLSHRFTKANTRRDKSEWPSTEWILTDNNSRSHRNRHETTNQMLPVVNKCEYNNNITKYGRKGIFWRNTFL